MTQSRFLLFIDLFFSSKKNCLHVLKMCTPVQWSCSIKPPHFFPLAQTGPLALSRFFAADEWHTFRTNNPKKGSDGFYATAGCISREPSLIMWEKSYNKYSFRRYRSFRARGNHQLFFMRFLVGVLLSLPLCVVHLHSNSNNKSDNGS